MSEFRQDLVSGDWIIMAPERERRPRTISKKKKKSRKPSLKKTCPFETQNLIKSGNWPPLASYPTEKNWEVIVIPNKYPALRHLPGCAESFTYGPHSAKTGAGTHSLVISRDHNKNFSELSLNQATKVFQVLQGQYKVFAKDGCSLYTSTFFNWGASAGATVYHPHYQVLTLPIIPPDVAHSLEGSRRYFRKHGRCVHCVMLAFDKKEKKRIIGQNSYAIAVAPFISRTPFEIRIFPKKHRPHFEKTPVVELRSIASALQMAMKKIKKHLHDPDLNFFIHTAPLKDHRYNYYHWHIEIVPKVYNWGGFELSTGVEINVVDPEKASLVLKGKKTKAP